MQFADFIINMFQKMKSEKRNGLIIIAVSLIFPSLAYIIYFNNLLYQEYDLFKTIVMSIIINIEMLILVYFIVFIFWLGVLLRKIQHRKKHLILYPSILDELEMMYKLKHEESDLSKKVQHEEKINELKSLSTLITNYTQIEYFTTPLVASSLMYIVHTVFTIAWPIQKEYYSAIEFLGKINVNTFIVVLLAVVYLVVQDSSEHSDIIKKYNSIFKIPTRLSKFCKRVKNFFKSRK